MKVYGQAPVSSVGVQNHKAPPGRSHAELGDGPHVDKSGAAVVRLSAQAVELARAKALPMDPARVERLRSDLETGALQVEPARVAQKLLEDDA